jgi:hypothetical protein
MLGQMSRQEISASSSTSSDTMLHWLPAGRLR